MKLILEGNRIKTIEDFHREIKSVLELPDYYGSNLDALWDCLTGWVKTPVTLVWKDFDASVTNIGDYANKALSIFRDAEERGEGFRIECNA
jgi:ribonuclease inhibitor